MYLSLCLQLVDQPVRPVLLLLFVVQVGHVETERHHARIDGRYLKEQPLFVYLTLADRNTLGGETPARLFCAYIFYSTCHIFSEKIFLVKQDFANVLMLIR